jgi:hypothetical protein
MPTANRHLEKLMSELGIRQSSESTGNDDFELSEENQESEPPEPPQRDEAQCTVTSPWAA